MMNLPFTDPCAVLSKLPQREYSHIRRTGLLDLTWFRSRKAFLVPARVFSLERSSFRSFCGAIQCIQQKKYDILPRDKKLATPSR